MHVFDRVILSDEVTYNKAMLDGKTNTEYALWITSQTAWGGMYVCMFVWIDVCMSGCVYLLFYQLMR